MKTKLHKLTGKLVVWLWVIWPSLALILLCVAASTTTFDAIISISPTFKATTTADTIVATNFTGNGAALTNTPGGTLAGAVVALVSATNKVSTIYASMTNVVSLTFMCLDTTNATVSISNIVEGVSFNIFASAYTTNKVAWSIRHPL